MITRIVPPFEKRRPGKSSKEEKKKKNTKIWVAVIIAWGYPVLSHGIYQQQPCLGFDPDFLLKYHADNRRDRMDGWTSPWMSPGWIWPPGQWPQILCAIFKEKKNKTNLISVFLNIFFIFTSSLFINLGNVI